MSDTTTQLEKDYAAKEPTYRIIQLRAENVQKLKAVEITPNGSTVTLSGKNAAGKSSVITSIAMVLGGAKFIPERPIRQGASKAESTLDMGEFTASLKITQGNSKLTLRSKDGADIRSPATLLKSYSNEILLDPVGFLRLGENPEGRREQGSTLRKLVGLDFSKLDVSKDTAYREREAVNRELRQAQAKLAGYPEDPTAPEQEVGVNRLMEQLEAIEKDGREQEDAAQANNDGMVEAARIRNGEKEKVKVRYQECIESLQGALQQAAELEAEIKEAERTLTELRNRKTVLKQKCDRLGHDQQEHQKVVSELKFEDLEALKALGQKAILDIRSAVAAKANPIREAISRADETNTKFRTANRRRELVEEVKALQAKSAGYTKTIEDVDSEKSQLLQEAKFPLEGLSFDETGILLNGLPLNQGSQAQQLKAVLAIGFSLKPKIRVALIREASLLDEESMKAVADIAEAHDGQIWLERVGDGVHAEAGAIIIEDGSVRE